MWGRQLRNSRPSIRRICKKGCKEPEKYYDALYETLVNGKEQLVKPEETIWQLEMLENGIKLCQ